MKKVVLVGAHSAEEVEERVFPSGQQYHRQAFAASQSHQIPGLSFLVAVKKSEIDGKEEGGRATDSHDFDCIGDRTEEANPWGN